MSRRALLRALRDALGPLAPEVPLPPGFKREIASMRDIDASARYYTLPSGRMSVSRENLFKPHSVSWDVSYDRLRPLVSQRVDRDSAQRINNRIGLKVMREVVEALRNDVDNFSPKALKFFATTASKARLYHSAFDQLGAKYGYSPTLSTRANRAVLKALRRHEQRHGVNSSPWWWRTPLGDAFDLRMLRGTYKRQGLTRRALEDALAAGGPAALGYMAAEASDE